MLTHTYTLEFLDSPDKSEGSLCALNSTSEWEHENMSTRILISLSEMCKHLKRTTETAQGAKSCPSVSELACD